MNDAAAVHDWSMCKSRRIRRRSQQRRARDRRASADTGLSHAPSLAGRAGNGLRALVFGSRARRGRGADGAAAGGPQRPAGRATQVSALGWAYACSRDLRVSDPGWGRRYRAPAFAKRGVFAAYAHRDVGVGRVAIPGDGENEDAAATGDTTAFPSPRVRLGASGVIARGAAANSGRWRAG
jgi:hypothetical protein